MLADQRTGEPGSRRVRRDHRLPPDAARHQVFAAEHIQYAGRLAEEIGRRRPAIRRNHTAELLSG